LRTSGTKKPFPGLCNITGVHDRTTKHRAGLIGCEYRYSTRI